MITHKKEFGIYHWDIFDNETILVGEADTLVKAGVTGILNLASCYLIVPKRVKVRTIDLAMELGILPYYT